MSQRTLRGAVAVAGIGETEYYKRGRAPETELVLTLRAILCAAEDAGIDPREIDGFASYSNDRNEPSRLAAALGLPELRFSNMQWGGGGGGGSAAVANAAAAIHAGLADCVVVYRGLAQGQFGRFGAGQRRPTLSGDAALWYPYGLMSPAQMFAMRANRLMYEHGIGHETFRAISLASYHHAQANPRAVMHGRPLDVETYESARWIVEPYRLYDCCLENDGAGSHNVPDYATASFKTLAPRLYEMAGVTPSDVDVLQSYENFTAGVVMSLIEHGFCKPEEANEFITVENLLAPEGKLPLNTSGGNLAECYMHGFELQLEAVRQLRGTSTSQVPDAVVSMVTSGPMVTPVSNMILGSGEALG